MVRKASVVVLIPIYKPRFDGLEQFAVDYSLAVMGRRRDVAFAAPQGLDVSYYRERYPQARYETFAPEFFASVDAYSRLLLDAAFYRRFDDRDFVLLLQPDAILLSDQLDYWTAQPFDYIGAPWPEAVELFVKLDRFRGELGRTARSHVGNGGLSLRRVRKCLSLIQEFPENHFRFAHTGTNEDSFYSLLGQLSNDFVIPNEITASRFAMELRPDYYHAVNGGHYPMGVHAWALVQPAFWAPCIPPLASVLAST
jgi:hypothetical protein